MRSHPPARCPWCSVFLLATALGCQALHSYRPVGVLVVDAETKQPIPAAQAHISYLGSPDSSAPYESCGKTGADGIARLRAAPYGGAGILLHAAAPGYQSETLELPFADVCKIEPAHWFESTDRRPADFLVELYTEPGFSVTLVVPAGYRGLIKAEIHVEEDSPCPPGQRCFRYLVGPSGGVKVVGPGVLRRVLPAGYRAEFDDGTPLGSDMDIMKVGFRWVKGEGQAQYFVVGTKPDYDRFCRQLLAEPAAGDGRSREPEKGGGRGGRRHRGNAGASP
jgi:hypothetical protein